MQSPKSDIPRGSRPIEAQNEVKRDHIPLNAERGPRQLGRKFAHIVFRNGNVLEGGGNIELRQEDF